MWYNLNIKKLSILILPPLLRKIKIINYLFSLIKPLEILHYSWLQFRFDNIYKLNHNSQICYMQGMLNDRFDPIQRRIIITNSHRYKQQYIYTEVEKKIKYLGTIYLRQDADFEDNGADFLVLVPVELLNNDNFEMKALIDYYRLASKRYKIEPLEDLT